MDVHRLLEQWALRPSKGLGQNFLVDQAALEKTLSWRSARDWER